MADPPPLDPPRPWPEQLSSFQDLLAQLSWRRVALGGAVAVAVLLGAVLLLRKPPPPPLVLPRAQPEGPVAGASPAATAGGAPATITVHAAGALNRPGVYAVPNGARVADVLAAAGGALPDADVDQVNLAAKVADAERVYLPKKGEAPPPEGSGGAGPGGQPAAPVDLNTATAEQLDTLPGVGPATAQAILQFRTGRGRFRSVDDLLEVRGIGPAKLETLRPLVKV